MYLKGPAYMPVLTLVKPRTGDCGVSLLMITSDAMILPGNQGANLYIIQFDSYDK